MKEEQPRYKVIADYPDNNDFPVGKIIEFHPWESSDNYWQHTVEDCQGKRSWLSHFFDKYPHLFKKLNWWEDVEDYPDFVKNKQGEVFMLHKVSKEMGLIENQTTDQHFESLFNLYPVTPEEYK